MTTGTQIIHIALSGLGLLALCVLYFWLYREYRVEKFRFELYVIRDRLFDAARKGVISFDHPAYISMRKVINRIIRFGHRVKLLDVLVFGVIDGLYPYRREEDRLPRKLFNAIDTLEDTEAQHVLQMAFIDTAFIVCKHMLWTSPTMLCLFANVIAYKSIRKILQGGWSVFSTWTLDSIKSRIARLSIIQWVFSGSAEWTLDMPR